MKTPLRVLIVEDSEDDTRLLARELERAGYAPHVERVDSEASMLRALESPWQLVLSDHDMPGFSGAEALALLRWRGLDTPFIFVSATAGEDVAVAAMRAGASDYVRKDDLRRLAPAIARELREAEVRGERMRLEAQLRQSQKLEAVGELAGGIAHDFNNLLGVIIGWTELLRRETDADDPRAEALGEIRRAADSASALTRQLLAFSRQQAIAPCVGAPDVARDSEVVLVVEDSRPLRKLIVRSLESLGYTVLQAGDGREALAVCERHAGPIDLLLTDVIMPEMGGRPLAEAMARKRPATRVLYVSGHARDEVSRQGVLAPGTAYLQKPFTPAELARRVRGLLDGKPAADGAAAE